MAPTTTAPHTTLTSASILAALTLPRILDLARLFGVRLRASGAGKRQLANLLGAQLDGRAPLILRELGREEGSKVAQNVAAGVAGLFIWPLWFAMDFQGAATKEVAALQQRQSYLARLSEQKSCAAAPMPATGLTTAG